MKKIFFDHIQKSAGRSIEAILKNHFGENNLLVLNGRFRDIIKNDFKCIMGHTEYLPDDSCILNDIYIFTVLRNPIERIISFFFYNKNDIIAETSFLSIRNTTFADFIYSDKHSEILSNNQTKHFFRLLIDYDSNIKENYLLEKAKEALDKINLVGVFHEINDFVDILCHEINLPPIKKIPHVNITSKRPKLSEVDPKIIRRLEELNQLDLALYDYATQLFNEKKRQVLRECIERRHREIYNSSSPPSTQGASSPLIPLPKEEKKSAIEAPFSADFGNRQLEIINVEVKGAISLRDILFSGEEIIIRVAFRAHIDVKNLTIGIYIHDRFGRLAFGTNSECLGYTLYVHANGIYFVDYRFRNDLGIGVYTVGAALHIGSSHLSSCFHWRDEVTRFEVVGNIGYHFEGAAKIYPKLRCGILSGNPADIQILPAAQDWPRLQQIAIHTPKLTEFRAQICLLQALEQLRPNEVIAIEAEITNTSSQTWGSTGQSPVHLSYHWQNLSGEWLEFDGLRTPLPYDIAPGETFRHYLTIKSPSQSGDALLQPTLVQEGVAWFDKQGYPPLEIRVRIGE